MISEILEWSPIIAIVVLSVSQFRSTYLVGVGVNYGLNILLKAIFRDGIRDPRCGLGLDPINSGFPSGHAQFWIMTATYWTVVSRSPYVWILWPIAIIVMYSRILNGCHDVKDLIGGAVVGFVVGVILGNLSE